MFFPIRYHARALFKITSGINFSVGVNGQLLHAKPLCTVINQLGEGITETESNLTGNQCLSI